MLQFQGTVTGTASGGEAVVCDPTGCIYNGAESDQFAFSGHWSNGWDTSGDYSGNIVGGIASPQTTVVLTITTTGTVPEPGTIALLAPGLFSLAGILRRMPHLTSQQGDPASGAP
jgi:hypothetical protein